jgi:hypothetical protein
MAFNNQKPRVLTVEHDFNRGDGKESVYFKSLSPAKQSTIFTSKLVVMGKNPDGSDKWGLQPKDLVDSQLAALAESIVTDETATTKMFKIDQLKNGDVDPDIVDQLVTLFNDHVGFSGPESIQRAKDKQAAIAAGDDPPTVG